MLDKEYDFSKHYVNIRDINNVKVGTKMICYDDGKIKPSREIEITITEIIPFKEAELDLIVDWKDEVENCDWLYNKQTDYFIKAVSNDVKITDIFYFVRDVRGDWFSLGYWAGILFETPVDWDEYGKIYG